MGSAYYFDINLIILFICAVSAFYWFLNNNFDYWRKRNVNGLAAYPIVGTQGEILRLKSHAAEVMQKIYNQFPQEKVVGGFIGRTPELIIRDPDLIKILFIKDFQHFTDHLFNFDGKREPLTQNLLFSKGDVWKTLRQKLTPAFTSGRTKNMFPLIHECVGKFQKYLSTQERSKEKQEIRDLMSKFTMDNIGTCAFGLELNSMANDDSEFRKMGYKLFEPSMARGMKMFLKQTFNRMYEFFGLTLFEKEVETFFLEIVKSILQSRNYEKTSRHDLIDILIELKASNTNVNINDRKIQNNVFQFTDSIIAAQAFIFFSAGYETSSTTMGFALYEIAKNPDIQQNIIDEIEKVLDRHKNVLTYEAVKDMKYLDMVIDETLRKYPAFGILNRICTLPYHFKELGFKIDEKVVISIPIYAIQHDPQYFPDPEKFIPERFTAEAKETRHPFTYLPFGEGPRKCIAMGFGKLQAKIGLISLLQNYIVKTNSRTSPQITFEPKTFILQSKDGIWLTLEPRLSSNTKKQLNI